jgi:hypothetical protein
MNAPIAASEPHIIFIRVVVGVISPYPSVVKVTIDR